MRITDVKKAAQELRTHAAVLKIKRQALAAAAGESNNSPGNQRRPFATMKVSVIRDGKIREVGWLRVSTRKLR
jgi:hypothetical protein